MKPNVFSNSKSRFSIRHRAVCKSDKYKGPWRSTPDEAYTDAEQHRGDGAGHIVEVLTEQTIRMRLE